MGNCFKKPYQDPYAPTFTLPDPNKTQKQPTFAYFEDYPCESCEYFNTPGGCPYGANCHKGHFSAYVLALTSAPQAPPAPQPSQVAPTVFCPYLSAPGGCKFGKSCRNPHPY